MKHSPGQSCISSYILLLDNSPNLHHSEAEVANVVMFAQRGTPNDFQDQCLRKELYNVTFGFEGGLHIHNGKPEL